MPLNPEVFIQTVEYFTLNVQLQFNIMHLTLSLSYQWLEPPTKYLVFGCAMNKASSIALVTKLISMFEVHLLASFIWWSTYSCPYVSFASFGKCLHMSRNSCRIRLGWKIKYMYWQVIINFTCENTYETTITSYTCILHNSIKKLYK